MSDNNVLELLQICDLAKNWPHLRSIHDVAMGDLAKFVEEAKAELEKRAADLKAKAEAEAAKIAAALKAETDKQKAADEAAEKAKAVPPPTSGPATTDASVERVV